jgi:hypothetical protein
MPLALALATAIGLGVGAARVARADGFLPPHVLPGWVPAYDFTTGQQYQAPPIPYGHYAKNLDDYLGGSHCLSCKLQSLLGGGHGLFNHGDGSGHGHQGNDGCGSGHGLFGHHGDSACVVPGCGGGAGCGHLGNGHGCGAGTAVVGGGPYPASAQAAPVPSGQSGCGAPGCHISKHHFHLGHHGNGDGMCGEPGCGSTRKHGHGTGCGLCGGRGCGNCLSGLNSGLHSRLASLSAMLHPQKVSYFVGAGGPVRLTPGYVPYIVATRSPRDYFAFPPMNPNDP